MKKQGLVFTYPVVFNKIERNELKFDTITLIKADRLI